MQCTCIPSSFCTQRNELGMQVHWVGGKRGGCCHSVGGYSVLEFSHHCLASVLFTGPALTWKEVFFRKRFSQLCVPLEGRGVLKQLTNRKKCLSLVTRQSLLHTFEQDFTLCINKRVHRYHLRGSKRCLDAQPWLKLLMQVSTQKMWKSVAQPLLMFYFYNICFQTILWNAINLSGTIDWPFGLRMDLTGSDINIIYTSKLKCMNPCIHLLTIASCAIEKSFLGARSTLTVSQILA